MEVAATTGAGLEAGVALAALTVVAVAAGLVRAKDGVEGARSVEAGEVVATAVDV